MTTKAQVSNKASKKGSIPKRIYIISAVMLAVLLAVAGVYSLCFFKYPLALKYSIKPFSVDRKLIQVSLKVGKRNRAENLELYKGDALVTDLKAYNDNGELLRANEKDGIIKIYCEDENSVNVDYKITLGDLAKHGHRGEVYDDMFAFEGDQALLLPSQAYTEQENDIKRDFKKVEIDFDIPNGWDYCIPFAKKTGLGVASSVDSATWSKLYELRKACFAFGKFAKLELKNNKGKIDVYIDPGCKNPLTDEVKQGINNLYSYYSSLFDYSLPEFSLLFLRTDNEDNSYIMGGSSSQTLGSTFMPDDKRDWELLGHRFFHAFFDSKMVGLSQFHAAPQLWFYEGLATYYENVSMNSLPESIKNKLGIDVQENFNALFREYLYGRYKDPSLFTLTPMDEEKISQSNAQTEFLHYTQAPLTVKAMEDISFQKYGTHDRIIKYIIDSKPGNLSSLQGIIQNALGNQMNDFAGHYMFGSDTLNLWSLSSGKEDSSQVVKQLSDFEYNFWTWFRLEIADYPIDKLSEDGLEELAQAADRENAHFADEETEARIAKYSPALYKLLKQYALRAKVCGADFKDPELRFKLLGDKDNAAKWEEYRKTK